MSYTISSSLLNSLPLHGILSASYESLMALNGCLWVMFPRSRAWYICVWVCMHENDLLKECTQENTIRGWGKQKTEEENIQTGGSAEVQPQFDPIGSSGMWIIPLAWLYLEARRYGFCTLSSFGHWLPAIFSSGCNFPCTSGWDGCHLPRGSFEERWRLWTMSSKLSEQLGDGCTKKVNGILIWH